LAEETGVIVRKGAWYSYKGDNISQGRDNAIKYLEDNPEVAQEVQQQVRQKLEMELLSLLGGGSQRRRSRGTWA